MVDRVIVITGAFGALGRAVVARARETGARVVAIDAAASAPESWGAAGGPPIHVVAGVDLTDPSAATPAVQTAVDTFGRLDVLVNIAGGFAWETVGDGNGNGETWTRLYRSNLLTALNACRAALPSLLRSDSARIINVGAFGALRAGEGMGAYGASKAAVHRLTEALAAEHRGKVTVNAVLPSIIDTPTNRSDMPDADFGAWVTPDELASVILFLASEAAGGVTGALVPVVGRV